MFVRACSLLAKQGAGQGSEADHHTHPAGASLLWSLLVHQRWHDYPRNGASTKRAHDSQPWSYLPGCSNGRWLHTSEPFAQVFSRVRHYEAAIAADLIRYC